MKDAVFLVSLFTSSLFAAAHDGGGRWYYNIDADGVAIGGYDAVAYFETGTATQGRPDQAAVHLGVTYHFADAHNRKLFENHPEAYLPQYGGWCAFAISVDSDKYGFGAVRFGPDPARFLVEDGKLYLFANLPAFDARALWQQEDAAAQKARGDAFWAGRVALAEKIGALPEGMHPRAPLETAQFDFIIGTWHTDVKWMVNPQLGTYGPTVAGTWKAYYHWDGFGIADDWRQNGVPGSGGPAYRSFDPLTRKWVMTYIPSNQPRAAIWPLEGQFDEKGELTGEMEGKDRRGRTFLQRVYFYDIEADHFSWRADRSYDGGKTWIEKFSFAACRRVG